MSYYYTYLKYKNLPFEKNFSNLSISNIESSIINKTQNEKNLLSLLSPKAEQYLESMAKKARELTLRNFGKTIQLYTPMYLSNYCQNQCTYCGFNSKNNLLRKRLNMTEVESEAKLISASGLKHILILTGESLKFSPVSYIKTCVKILKKYFNSISIEIYALKESDYLKIAKDGVDGLSLYQETYNEEIYNDVHKAGPKKDYLFRLDAPERAAKAGFRKINLGVLLGLSGWREDAFFMGLHAKYLQDKFPNTEISISLPRLRACEGNFKIPYEVIDKNIVQIITALRIFLPRLGITISTRESPELRDNLINLGITRMSAGSSTIVGGRISSLRGKAEAIPQFEILDTRDVEEIKKMLLKKGYQPVLKDWVIL